MNNAKQIFDYIQTLNPTTSTISSLGSFVTEINQQVSDQCFTEVNQAITNDKSLAYKILHSANKYTAKQLWVIAYELVKNEEFSKMVADFYAEINRKENSKKAASTAKLKANKEASADVLEPIKNLRKLGAFGKWLNTSGNPYRKQHFSKKYSESAVNSFLATL
jgi:hypothetical protein